MAKKNPKHVTLLTTKYCHFYDICCGYWRIIKVLYIAYLVLFTEKYCFVSFDFKKCSFLISSEFIRTSHRGSLRILYTKISLDRFKIWAVLLYSLTASTNQTVNVIESKNTETRGTAPQHVAGFTNPEKHCQPSAYNLW